MFPHAKKVAIAVGAVLFCLFATLVMKMPWLFIGSSSGVTIPIPVESASGTLEILKVGPSNLDDRWLEEDSGDIIVDANRGVILDPFAKRGGKKGDKKKKKKAAPGKREAAPERDETERDAEETDAEDADVEDTEEDTEPLPPLTDDDVVIDFETETDPVDPEPSNSTLGSPSGLVLKDRISSFSRWCGGAPPKVKPWSPSSPSLRDVPRKPIDKNSAKKELGKCLRDISACGMSAALAARSMTSIRRIGGFRKGGMRGLARFKSCAIVGNSGHILKKEYGPYIDRHDAVVRFNILSLSPRFAPHIGTKTTIRVLNLSLGTLWILELECIRIFCHGGAVEHQRGESFSFTTTGYPTVAAAPQTTSKPPSSPAPGRWALKMMLLWHPLERARIHSCLKRKYGRRLKVLSTSPRVESELKRSLLALRRDAGGSLSLQRFRGGRSKQQLTSGAHGILIMLRLCEHVSLYGMTTYPSSRKGPDQYRGRKGKPNTAFRVHDWSGESAAWRLLHASGRATICSV
eukprot:jgi/Mesvir1/15405/Mv06590-RA.1